MQTNQLKIWLEQLKDQRLDVSLDAETMLLEDPTNIPDPTGLIKQVMAYAGKAAQLGGLLTFERVMLRGMVYDQGHFQIKPIRLSATDLQIWGTLNRQRLPRVGSIQVDLSAKRPGREEADFHWQTE